jgi:glucosamine--fructose-6-phosphate aminotransferase (isomerizing)
VSVVLGRQMAAEMSEQPVALAGLLSERTAAGSSLRHLPAPTGIVLIARGSSDTAAAYGRYVLEAAVGVPVTLIAPSLWTRYGRHARLDGQLAIGMSQSGRTPEITRVLQMAGRVGATTLAITNHADSPLANAADVVVALGVGRESAVPATKSFLGQVLALALVAERLGERLWPEDALDGLAAAQERLLRDDAGLDAIAADLSTARAVVQVGSGYLYAIAQEGALKMLETVSMPVLAYSAADLLHGPIAVAGPDVPVVCYSAPGPLDPDVRRAAGVAAERGAPVVWVGEEPPAAARHHLLVEPVLPEPLAPLLHAIRAQQLALAVSRALGRDPDVPPGLSKVTETV